MRWYGGLRRQARAIAALTVLTLLFLLLSALANSSGLLAQDVRVTRWLQGFRRDWLDSLVHYITLLGDTWPLLTQGAIAAALFLRRGWRLTAVFCATVAPVALLLNLLIKDVIGRPRPEDGIVYVLLTPIGLSFPSGHAMAATTFYGFMALLSWLYLPPSWRQAAVTLFCSLAVAVSLSRVYLGVHWFSDVIGGVTGGLLLLLGISVLHRRLTKVKKA